MVAVRGAVAWLTILNDILDLSKIEAGKMTLEAINFDLQETAGSAADVPAGVAKTSVSWASAYRDGVPGLGAGRPGAAAADPVNLVGNAVKFTAARIGRPVAARKEQASWSIRSPRHRHRHPAGETEMRSSKRLRRPTARTRAGSAAPGWA